MSETTETPQADDQADENAGAMAAEVEAQAAQGEAELAEEAAWEAGIEALEKQKQVGHEAGEQGGAFERGGTSGKLESSEAEAGLHLQTPNMRFILDIPLQMTVELGRKRLLIQDLLQLSQGSVLELTKQVGDAFEVLVNQKLIARGEVVVVNDKFGVRITDILSPTERVQQLQ